jgi:hypothetical protein
MLSNEEESDQCSVDRDPWGKDGRRKLERETFLEVHGRKWNYHPDPVEAGAGREPRDHGDGCEIGAATPGALRGKKSKSTRGTPPRAGVFGKRCEIV